MNILPEHDYDYIAKFHARERMTVVVTKSWMAGSFKVFEVPEFRECFHELKGK